MLQKSQLPGPAALHKFEIDWNNGAGWPVASSFTRCDLAKGSLQDFWLGARTPGQLSLQRYELRSYWYKQAAAPKR